MVVIYGLDPPPESLRHGPLSGAKEVEVAVEKSVLKPIRIPARMATRP